MTAPQRVRPRTTIRISPRAPRDRLSYPAGVLLAHRRDSIHRHAAEGRDDARVAGQGTVKRFVAGVDQERPAVQRQELGLGRDHGHVVATHARDHGRAELLVPAPEDMALAADDRDDDAGAGQRGERRGPRRSSPACRRSRVVAPAPSDCARVEQRHDVALVEVGPGRGPVDHGVDAEQRLVEAELARRSREWSSRGPAGRGRRAPSG